MILRAVATAPRFKREARRLIKGANEVSVLAHIHLEIAIKERLGKLEADPRESAAAITASGFIELPVNAENAAGVGRLAQHHNDPFDRLLVSRALAEPLRLPTADDMVAKYSDLVLRA